MQESRQFSDKLSETNWLLHGFLVGERVTVILYGTFNLSDIVVTLVALLLLTIFYV
jgi:hypothetical protein